MKKVSVIVPAYNAHDTLARCLGSLVHQTLENIEIIVVNDASKDDTWEIMKRCESQFPDKVTIINSGINSGPGGARNIGIDASTGEYIGLVDADDYVAATMYEKLYEQAEKNKTDIADCGFYRESNDKALLTVSDDLEGELDDYKRSKLICSGGYLVTKIFKRELFNDPQIRMQRNMTALEDFEILIYMYLRAKSISAVKEVLYNYCDTAGSSTKMTDLDIYYDSVYRAMKGTYETCHAMPTYEGSQRAVEYMLVNIYSYGINRCLHDQIAMLGPGMKNVGKYFEKISVHERELIKNLVMLRHEVIHIDYDENPEIIKRIAPLDLKIIKRCDELFVC
ncbi:MAG: glycosyltransferase family 2 protein [Butyrivibrio sp.]|nr:glycosyltransferase family 2 protein [Butyrivibrio sp.]